MKLALQATLSFGLLALCLATTSVRWCTISNEEQAKCIRLQQECFAPQQSKISLELICVRKADLHDCIQAIKDSEADAITLDAGHIAKAGMSPYNLKPIVAEVHVRDSEETCTSYYAVAVVKKGIISSLQDLNKKKSCHTGFGRSAGWVIPVGTLVEKGLIKWAGTETEPVEKAVGRYFLAGCCPGISGVPELCRLCAGKCDWTDLYAGYSGALKCMTTGGGDVAFVNEGVVLALSPEERSKYDLLCLDDTTRPIDQYKSCYWAKVPSHAVVARSVDGRVDEIWTLLSNALQQSKEGQTACQLFGSPQDQKKDLLFKNSAVTLTEVPKKMDAQLYLGQDLYDKIQVLRRERSGPDSATMKRIVWCAVGKAEQKKCDLWSGQSNGAIECAVAETTEDCIVKIMKEEADAMTLDGGHVYTAGKCGLIPVLAEIPREDSAACKDPEKGVSAKGYSVVAVAKKSDGNINWNNLNEKKSCHTGVGRTAGWNVPMGIMSAQKNHSCEFDKFFLESCAPGAPLESSLCRLCKGSGGEGTLPGKHKCKANSNEIYYGYIGSVRCLVEGGDVAFVKYSIIREVTEGENKPAWATGLSTSDFVLLGPNGERCPYDEPESCILAKVSNHAVVSRPEQAEMVKTVILEQQKMFGSHGNMTDAFQMFQSETKDSLFKDNTECLAVPIENTFKGYLGMEYVKAVESLSKCSSSDLLDICNFSCN